ncbi:MAG: phosphotransferase [Candidatus Bathyarchaeia archaeon]
MLSRLELAEAIAEAWNHEEINYAVLHGLERYPESLGRDLDILVHADQTDQALKIVIELAKNKGWPVVISPPSLYGKRIVAFADNYKTYIEIHTMERLSWAVVSFADKPEPLYQIGPFKVDPWASFVKRILMVFLSGGKKRFRERPHELILNKYEKNALSQLPRYMGSTVANQFISLLEKQDVDGLFDFVPIVKRALLLRSLFHPVQLFVNSSRFLKRRIARYFSPCGPIVAIVGPDGIGKTTTLSYLERELPSVFTRIRIRHWRPGLLPHLGTLVGKKPPEAGPPRRHPGHFHWLRLLYYFGDFWLGYWLKDILDSSKQRVILYDRCVLDMIVDPLRFGLQSKWGTSLLWKLTPKPDLVILLWDSPQRIVERKQELSKEEIESQLKEWAKLIYEGKIQAIIQVDSDPKIIARRVSEIVLEVFVRKNGGNVLANQDSDTLRYTTSILVLGNKVDDAPSTMSRHQMVLISEEESINGFTKLDEYAIFPNKEHPKVLIPLVNSKSSAASLQIYNAMKPLARVGKWMISIGLQWRLVQPILKDRLYLHAKNGISVDELSARWLKRHLQTVFGREDLTIAVFLGTLGKHHKPLVQVMDNKGAIIGYVKIGWNQETISFVQREEKILNQLVNENFSTAIIPRILYAGWWNNYYLLVQEPPPGRTKTPPLSITSKHVKFLCELLEIRLSHVKESYYWERLRERIKLLDVFNLYYAHLFKLSIETIERKIGNVGLPFGFRHGDFTPWNTFLLKDKIYVFDWEYAEECSPPGWDLFHFLTQTAILVYRRAPAQIYKKFIDDGKEHDIIRTYFKHLEIPLEFLELLFALYIVDVASWYFLRDRENVDIKGQLLRETWLSILSIFLTRKDLKVWAKS